MDPIVETVEGTLRGTTRRNLDDEEFYCFFGVPYAQQPVGELRFKAPQPLLPWTGVRDVSKEGERFYQRDFLTRTLGGTEEGLHLNVYTKKPIPQGSKLNSVMVWIHGGGFTEGSNNTDMHGPEFLMPEDIVLVTINYRVGPIGFLQLDDPSLEIFGNAGMKDQVEALKWVQRNIKNFGGDPDNVTIAGASAGGGSVQYLVLSPSARGLFHKAMIQSGAVTNYWGYGHPFTREMLEHAGKGDLSDKEALAYLRSLSIEELFDIGEKYASTKPIGVLGIVAPVVEKPNPSAFLTRHPYDILKTGDYNKVPIVIGYTSDECGFLSEPDLKERDNRGEGVTGNMTPKNVVSKTLRIEEENEVCKKYTNQLTEVYDHPNVSKTQFFSDVFFIMGIIESAMIHARTSSEPVYLYRLSLISGLNGTRNMLKSENIGACHGDDMGYIFSRGTPVERGSPEYGYVKRFVKMWTNFMKFSNPTPEDGIWKPVTEDITNFLDIDRELIPGVDPECERFKVYKEIFPTSPLVLKFT